MNDPVELLQWIEAARWRHLMVESAGVFWIAAELAILVLVVWGRAHLRTTPHKAKLQLPRRMRQTLYGVVGQIAALSLLVIAHFVVTNPKRLGHVDEAYAVGFERIHLLLWATFVTIWVIVEIAIVYVGFRGYQHLRALLSDPPHTRTRIPRASLLAFVFTLSIVGFASANVSNVESELLPAQNILYFYLRIAGIVWIAVEWIAAYVLVQSYYLLANARSVR